MSCIEDLPHDVLKSNISFKESREIIEQDYPLVYHINPGFKLLGNPLIGTTPIAIGIDGDSIIFPYTKPCHGTYLLKINDPDEVNRLSQNKRLRKFDRK
jgi:hypothetical protein